MKKRIKPRLNQLAALFSNAWMAWIPPTDSIERTQPHSKVDWRLFQGAPGQNPEPHGDKPDANAKDHIREGEENFTASHAVKRLKLKGRKGRVRANEADRNQVEEV